MDDKVFPLQNSDGQSILRVSRLRALMRAARLNDEVLRGWKIEPL